MSDKPILMFPTPTEVGRQIRRGNPIRGVHIPSHQEQINRLTSKISSLEEAITRQRVVVTPNTAGVVPEYAVVFETVGTIDNFINAVKKIEGLEWLTEIDEIIDGDEDFYMENDQGEVLNKPLNGRLFLVLTNQTAMSELISLWNKYKNRENFERGTAKWRTLFEKLKDLRLWSVQDRFYKTGLKEVLYEKKSIGEESIKFEVELWYREDHTKRIESSSRVKQLVIEAGGRVITESVITDISYHSLLLEAPISMFEELSEESSIQLIKSDSIMFFRPTGQSLTVIPSPNVEESNTSIYDAVTTNDKPPVIALFDGLPLQNHDYLREKVIIDDPDDFESNYPANKRFHGTTMASLIINGELDSFEAPLERKIYVRPIMKPNPYDFINNSESIPDDILTVDLIHRAVKRIFEGDGEEDPVSPNIKVINLSIGDISRPFDLQLSPLAKLIDYLSEKYKVLFIISAGNFSSSITLDTPKDDFRNLLGTPFLSQQIIKKISESVLDRRILSPSESINSLCVGSSHKDSSTIQQIGRRIDVFEGIEEVMSSYSRVGLGYRNSIKPDLLLPGGKQLFLENVMGYNGKAVLDASNSSISPGQKVAFPGNEGSTNSVTFTRGTSNSTALASRFAGEIYEILDNLNWPEEEKENILNKYGALFIKTLLVHATQWNSAYQYYKEILQIPGENRFRDKKLPRYIGYGFVQKEKILNSSNQRVTLIGYGNIKKQKGHLFELPLPPSLNAINVKRRLTITLSWFSPTNKSNKKYRKAHLWFSSENDVLQLDRLETDAKAVQRGTLQHEIFEGDRAAAFLDGDLLKIIVSCREDASGLSVNEEISYTIAVTLEVAPDIELPIYTEVQERIRTQVPIRSQIQ